MIAGVAGVLVTAKGLRSPCLWNQTHKQNLLVS